MTCVLPESHYQNKCLYLKQHHIFKALTALNSVELPHPFQESFETATCPDLISISWNPVQHIIQSIRAYNNIACSVGSPSKNILSVTALPLTSCYVSECVTEALLRNNWCKHPLSAAMHHLLYNWRGYEPVNDPLLDPGPVFALF